MATGPRLLLTDAAFLVFCTKLGDEREAAGAGPAARISIGQRADVLQVIDGLNTSAGWLAPGVSPDAETAETIFARHLAPVLCENPLMRGALDRVLAGEGVPGTFQPALPRTPKPPVVNPGPVLEPRQSSQFVTYLRSEFRWKWQGLRGVLRFRAVRFVALMAGLAAVLTWGVQRYPEVLCHAPAAATWLRSQVPAPGCGEATIVVNPVALPGRDEGRRNMIKRPAPRPTPVSQDIAALGPLDRALSVLEVAGYDMSPALLAQHLATTAPVGLDPALYLDAMLTRWPMPADQPIPRSKMGAMALVNFGLAAALLEGDRGAVTAIQGRLSGMTAERTLAVSLDGQYLPDLDFPEDENIASLAGLVDIDPRLAWFAVDDAARVLFAPHLRLTTKILDADLSGLSGLGSPTGTGSILFQTYDAAVVKEIVGEVEASFGITLRFDPAQAASLTFHDVLTAVRAGLQQPARLDRSFEMPLSPWRREVGLVPLGLPVLMLLWAVLGYPAALRRRLQHWPRPPLPGFHLIVPAPDRTPVLPPLARRVAQTLRHTAPRLTASLDVEASLARTLRQGGYFTPVLRQRRNVAAHVVLIHRRTLAEHEPRRIAALFGQMAAVGVSVTLFEYASDPGRLRPFGQLGGQTRDLSGLLQDDPEARLILVTSGDEFTGAGAYGVSAATLQTLLQWDQRVVVTPVPVGNWGLREWALSHRLRLPLARAGPDGLPDLAAIFPADPARAPVASAVAPPTVWLRKVITRRAPFDPIPPLPRLLAIGEAEAAMPQAPRPDRLEAMALTLKRWLGPEGYLWLQACAFYPVLRYPLTRWLGRQLFGPQASTRTLAQLTQLGWFAVGRMPTGLAARLRQGLSDVDRARIDAIFTRFYLTRQPDGASPAQDAGRGYRGERVAYEPDTLADPVAAARLLPAELTADPKVGDARLRLVRLVVLADRAAAVLAAGLVALALWTVWPDRTALPLPPAAWLPAIVVVVVGAVLGVAAMATLTALRRTRRGIGATGIKSAEPQA